MLRPGAIGDTIVAFPALAVLRAAFPEHRLHLVGNQAAGPLAVRLGVAAAFTPFDDPRLAGLFVPTGPGSAVDLGPVDLAVAWCADPEGILAENLRRLGARSVVVAPSRPPAGVSIHMSDYLVASLAALGLPSPPDSSRLIPGPGFEWWTDAIRSGGTRPSGERALLVHPGSGSPAKNWPAERYADLVKSVRHAGALRPVLVAGPADAFVVERIRRCAGPDIAVLWHRPLDELAGAMADAAGFVGNDSGPAHLAALVGCPTLVLFGPTDPAVWAPRGTKVRIVRHQPLSDLPTDPVLCTLRDLVSSGPPT